MKTLSAAMTTHINSEVMTLAGVWEITRQDGQVFRFTEHDKPIVFGGDTYSATEGFSPSDLAYKNDMSVTNTDVESFFGASGVTESDLLAGLYDRATFVVSLVNWQAPDEMGSIPLLRGVLGEYKSKDDTFELELRGLSQFLSQRIGRVYTQTCIVDLFSTKCGLDVNGNNSVTGLPHKETNEVETVTSNREFVVPVLRTVRNTPNTAGYDTQGVLVDEFGQVTLLESAPADGSELRPFEISTASELDNIRNDLYARYVLTADVDMSGWGLFTPIGASGLPFFGQLDGRGFKIQNLDLDHSGSPMASALFGTLGGGSVLRRIGIEDATVRSGNSTTFAAPLAADVTSNATVEDCYAEGGTVTTDGDQAGGLLGQTDATSTVSRCYAAVSRSGAVGTDVGGLTGDGSATESNTYFDSDVWGDTGDGGSASNLTTAQAQAEANYTGFDFANDWKINEGSDYPRHLDPGRC